MGSCFFNIGMRVGKLGGGAKGVFFCLGDTVTFLLCAILSFDFEGEGELEEGTFGFGNRREMGE